MVLLPVLLCCTSANAGESEGSSLHRWGVGWDDGIGIRYMADATGGVGLRCKVVHVGSTSDRGYTSNWGLGEYRDAQEVGLLLFRQHVAGKRFSFGPYAQALFMRWTHYKVRDLSFGVETGLRPTFTFGNRFVLETRVGCRLLYTRHREPLLVSTRPIYKYANDWKFGVIGSDIGPIGVVVFMVYF